MKIRKWLSVSMIALTGTLNAAEPVTDPIPQTIKHGDVNVKLEQVAGGLNSPVWLRPVPGHPERLFVLDQPGIIRLIENGKLVDQPVADLRPRMVEIREGFDERGLLGLAFHPDFTKTGAPGEGLLYTYTSEPANKDVATDFPIDMSVMGVELPLDHQAVIAEWRLGADGRTLDPASRREVMRIDQPQFNHDGGTILFGPDGLMYVGLGDGGAGNDTGPGHTDGIGNAQDMTKALGKVLRIDPLGRVGQKSGTGRYSVPNDNPFVGQDDVRPEIWAYGLRNPWRMAFTPEGQLVAGDVGQDHIEEVNIIQKGGNYGWNYLEGTWYFKPSGKKSLNVFAEPVSDRKLPSNMIPPVAMYDHDEGISIAGGYVYRGSEVPSLKGQYVFGEWTDVEPTGNGKKQNTGKGRLLYFNLSDQNPVIQEIVVDGGMPGYVTAVGEGASGELYVMTNSKPSPLGNDGKVWKVVAR